MTTLIEKLEAAIKQEETNMNLSQGKIQGYIGVINEIKSAAALAAKAAKDAAEQKAAEADEAASND